MQLKHLFLVIFTLSSPLLLIGQQTHTASPLNPQTTATQDSLTLEINTNLIDSLQLWATYYYIPTLSNNDSGITLLNSKEESLGLKLTPEDWCKAAIEGTARIQKDSNVYSLNYAGRSEKLQYDCRKCTKYKNYSGYAKTGKVLWSQTSGFGLGVKNHQLVPFRSIAVDNSIIPYGSVVFIPAAKGVKFIDTSGIEQTHDGLFFAADTGSQITGNHIDVFLGLSKDNPFSFITSSRHSLFDAYLVSSNKIRYWLLKMHQ